MNKPECAVKERCLLGESPLWSPDEQALYWVDIQNPTIHRFDPVTGERRRWLVETEIGSIGLAGDGKLVAGLRSGFALYDFGKGAFEPLADPEGKGRLNPNRLNDGKVDRGGRFWCGTVQDPGHGPVGVLYRLDRDRTCQKVENGFRIFNALAWSPDDKTIYFADSFERSIRAYDFDLTSGAIANRRTFASVPEDAGFPDGGTVDSEGFVWSAHIFGGRVTRYDPDGKIERVIELPVKQVTACTFGGANLDILYVTTASMEFSPAGFATAPLAGSVFAIDVGVRGLPEPRFGG